MDNNLYAAVDLGSNSFQLLIAHLSEGRFRIVDRIKSRVRLAEGMNDKGQIAADAMSRALTCLTLFAERLANINPSQIRITGTYTLRSASNAHEFITRAALVLNLSLIHI